jgi:bifunctional ADP-heptose synthase (sugar kinase/adenylyltransferase)
VKLLVIGEICRDIYVYGKCERLCPEAPVPVFKPERTEENLGMAGNVIANLQSLRPDIKVDKNVSRLSVIKRRFIDQVSGYILLRVDEGDIVSHGHGNDTKYDEYDAVIIADYNKGFLSEGGIRYLLDECRRLKVPTFLDTKKILGEWSKNATFVKINTKEYNENERALKLLPEYYCENLILTLGEAGSQWRRAYNTSKTSFVDTIAVSDVSGAGDTYMAAFAIKYLESKSVMDAMAYANKAARIAVSKRGVVAVSDKEIA